MALMFLLTALPSYATTWYADATNGVDSSTCNTAANPCKTLNQAIKINMVGGDTVYLKGTFSEQLIISPVQSGTASAYTTITTWPGEATAKINATGKNTVIPMPTGMSYIKIDNLELYGANNNGVTTTPGATNNIIFNRLKIHDLPSSAIGINSGTTSVTISNCIIYHNSINSSSALEIHGASDVYIYNNTFYNNKRESSAVGISINADVNNTYIKNNIFSTGSIAISLTGDISKLFSDNNDFHNLSSPVLLNSAEYSLAQWQTVKNQDIHSRAEDPLFVATTASAENLLLQTSSPMIDAGTDLSIAGITVDFQGEIRPYGTAYDIGADEFPMPAAPVTPVISNRTTTTAILTWAAPSTTTTSYVLEYGTDASYATVNVVTGLTTSTYAFTGLASNTTYYYRVKAIYTGITDYSSAYTPGSFATNPDKPTAFSATDRKAKTITVSWVPPAGAVTEYAVTYYNINDTSNVTELRTTNTTLQITDLISNSEYHFTCVAINGSAISESADFLTLRTKPAKVKNLIVPTKYLTATAAKIKWHTAGTDLTYQVKLMNKKGKKIELYKTSKLSKLITKLSANTFYKIQVRAKYNAHNLGTWSELKKFATLAE